MLSQYTGTRMFHVYKCQYLDITYSKPICRIISDYSTYESENHYSNVELNIYKMLLNVHISVTVSMCRSTHLSKINICNIPASIPNQSRTIPKLPDADADEMISCARRRTLMTAR